MRYLVGLPSHKNLRDELKELMARKQKVLPEVEEVSSDGIPLRAQGKPREHMPPEASKPEEPENHWRSMSQEPRHLPASSSTISVAQSRSQVSRANRAARYEAVRALHQRPSPLERLLAVCICPGRRCTSFFSQSPFRSEAEPRIREAFSIPTSPTSSSAGKRGVGMVPSFTQKSKHLATPAQRPCVASSFPVCASTIGQQELRRSSNCLPTLPKSVDRWIPLPNPASKAACPLLGPPGCM
jgi:hypothetical protein